MSNQPQPSQAFLPEGAKRTQGRNAQFINIQVGKAVASAVKSTLGPKGMDKLIVDELGDVVITNDGATILREISIEHPIGKMMVDIANAQDSEVGDGTTTAVVLAGGLLAEAEKLLLEDIHPSIIINGYRLAGQYALKELENLGQPLDSVSESVMADVAFTSMTGKATEASPNLPEMVVRAMRDHVKDVDDVRIVKKLGENLDKSELVLGIVLDKEFMQSGMPKEVLEAQIALVEEAFEVREAENDVKYNVSDPNQLQMLLDQEENQLKEMVESLQGAGATFLFCHHKISDIAAHHLRKAGITAVDNVPKKDMQSLAKATGANLVTIASDIESADLGKANVSERKIGSEPLVFVEDCEGAQAVTFLLRGTGEHVLDEAERAIHDALMAVSTAIKCDKIVAGGGAPEMFLSVRLRAYAKNMGGREQLAIEGFANALEEIPKQLAETAGLNRIDAITSLRAGWSVDGPIQWNGVNVNEGKLGNMWEARVFEPLEVKKQAIRSAGEVAEMILRIDDVIAGGGKKLQEGQ